MTRPFMLSRRAFLIRPLRLAGAALLAGCYTPPIRGESGPRAGLAENMAAVFRSEGESFSALGRVHLRSLAARPTAPELMDALFAAIPGLEAATGRADGTAIRSLLWQQFQAEFAGQHVVYLERFGVARSEARLYALLALLNQT